MQRFAVILLMALLIVAAVSGLALADDVAVTGVNIRVVEEESPRGPVVTDSPTPFTLVMLEGEAAVLEAIITPSNASDQVVSWTIEDEDVVSLSTSSRATVTAVGVGSTLVTVTTDDGGFTDSLTIIVTDDPDEVIGETRRRPPSPSPDSTTDTKAPRATPPTGSGSLAIVLGSGLLAAGLALLTGRSLYRSRIDRV